MERPDPNIIITGTPGVGKTSHCEQLAEKTGLHHLSINAVVKKHHIGTKSVDPDDPKTTDLSDEGIDRVLDCIQDDLENGGQIVEWHGCDIFPIKLIDLVVVLRCDNTKLYDRLKARDYSQKKIENNIDCEIMEVTVQEARDAYAGEIIQVLKSETTEDLDSNVDRLAQWVEDYRKDHGGGEAKAQAEEGGKDEDDPMFLHG